MTIWTNEIKELDKIYESFKGHIPDIVKEMEQLIRTDDPNVVMLYSRRCLEVIITDLCECELKRPRKTEPLKGIIDKLNSEEKVPAHIITSMQSLNSMATYGAHPKDFDPEQVKPVLNNLAIIIRWYLKYKDFKIVSKTDEEEKKYEYKIPDEPVKETVKAEKKTVSKVPFIIFGIVIIVLVITIYIFYSVIKSPKEEKEPWTGELLVDARNNRSYKIVTIDKQVWMAENLDVDRYSNGDLLPEAKKPEDWTKLNDQSAGAWCYYDNNSKNGKIYGRLYNFYAVNSGKLCPTGWHVPTMAEWDTLTYHAGDSIFFKMVGDSISWVENIAGNNLKETGTKHWTESKNVTNQSGFTALPGGCRDPEGPFGFMGRLGFWWSSDELNIKDAWSRTMYYNDGGVVPGNNRKSNGFAVRCIRDEPFKSP